MKSTAIIGAGITGLTAAFYLRRKGVPVTVYDAVLGGKAEAPTPDGPVTLTIPKGANTGTRLRLKGRGISDARGQRGDLFARLVVALPDTPDPALETFAEAWKKDRPYSPKRKG